MADLRFFKKEGPFSLGDLASRIEATVHKGSDETVSIVDVAPLDSAGPDEIAFLDNPKYVAAFEATKASACIVGSKFVDKAPAGVALLVSDQPYRSYALAAQCFYPASCRLSDTFGEGSTVSSAAHIHPSAKIGDGATIEPGAVVRRSRHYSPWRPDRSGRFWICNGATHARKNPAAGACDCAGRCRNWREYNN